MKTGPATSGFDLLRFWSAVSLAVAVAATGLSPLLMIMAGSCCSGPHDPTHGVFLLPVIPAFALLQALRIESMLAYGVAVGVSYGGLCFLLGLPAILIRRARRR